MEKEINQIMENFKEELTQLINDDDLSLVIMLGNKNKFSMLKIVGEDEEITNVIYSNLVTHRFLYEKVKYVMNCIEELKSKSN